MKKRYFLIIAGAVAVLAGCSRENANSPETLNTNTQATVDALKQNARETANAAGDLLSQENQKFMNGLQKKVQNLDARIDELTKKAENSSQPAKEKAQSALQDLKDMRAALAQKLDEAKSAGKEAWASASNSVIVVWEEAQKAYLGAKEKLEQ